MSLLEELQNDVSNIFIELDSIAINFDISYINNGTFDAATQTRINSKEISESWSGIRIEYNERDIVDFPVGKTIIVIIADASTEPFTINTKENYTITIDKQEYLVKKIKKDPANVTYTFVCIEK